MNDRVIKLAESLEESANNIGESVVKRVIDPRSIYSGQYINLGPDLILETSPDYVIRPGVSPLSTLIGRLVAGGNHELTGVLLSSCRMENGANATVEDVAPTILGLLGIKKPCFMEGRDLSGEARQYRMHVSQSLRDRSLLLGSLRVITRLILSSK